MKKDLIIKILFFAVAPIPFYLIYRLAVTDGLEKFDYALMTLFFGVLIIKNLYSKFKVKKGED
jgi:SNF family Na+-dependent transporter